MQSLGRYLLRKDLYANLLVLLFSLLGVLELPGSFMAGVLVGFITLTKGPRAGLVLLAWALLPAFAQLLHGHYGLYDLGVLRCALVWVVALLLRHPLGSWGRVLQFLAVTGLLVVLGFHWQVQNPEAWWVARLSPLLTDLRQDFVVALKAEDIDRALHWLAALGTGLMVAATLLGIVLELFLARWWQKSAVPTPAAATAEEMTRIALPQGFSGFLLFIMMLSWHWAWMRDLLPVLLTPWMVVGLSIFHFWARHRGKIAGVGLFAVYLLLFFIPFLAVFLVAILGVVDSWYDLRQIRLRC